jgi:hypothetical protein
MPLSLTERPRQISFKAKLAFMVLTLIMSLFLAVFTVVPAKAADATLVVDNPVVALGQQISISGSGFAAGEKIAIWVTGPDDDVSSLDYLNANGAGIFTTFKPEAVPVTAPPGVHTVTVQGLTSGTKAYATFTLLRPRVVGITADLGNGVTAITYIGYYWYPGEKVSYWVTDGAGDVYTTGGKAEGYVWATTNGVIPASPDDGIPSFRIKAPTPLSVTFYGKTSHQTVVVTQATS